MAKKKKVRCVSFGIQGDLSLFASVGGEVGIAFASRKEGVAGYKGGSLGWGTSGGAAGGIELGYWTVKPKDLAGKCYIIGLGAAYKLGFEIQIIFSKDWEFLGYQRTFPNIGVEVEGSFSYGWTKTF